MVLQITNIKMGRTVWKTATYKNSKRVAVEALMKKRLYSQILSKVSAISENEGKRERVN